MQNKKIAIVTLNGEMNYGNRLQNYAVQRSLEKLGYKVHTIVATNNTEIKAFLKRFILKILVTLVPGIILKLRPRLIRKNNFRKFNHKYIHVRYIHSTTGKIPRKINEEYDYFIVGSDQVWNPTFGGFDGVYDNMFLTFAQPNKRVCFSPSIGISTIPNEWKDKFTRGLEGFSQLCVREKSGVDIIKELTGRTATLVIDPTLMLDDVEWLKVSKKSKANDKPYVLEYFLGEHDGYELERIACERNLKRVKLLDMRDKDIYVSGPSEFIDLISKAELVCTDSFHACVFSIIFRKPFIIFKRQDDTKDMYSRIDTLLEMFSADTVDQPILVDGRVRDEVLHKERERLIEFLKRNLDKEGE